MWAAFANAKATHKNISVYAIFNDQSLNDMLTNDMVSFEQLGLACDVVCASLSEIYFNDFSKDL